MAEALMTYGIPGPKGDTGARGPTGAVGATGPQGPAGTGGLLGYCDQIYENGNKTVTCTSSIKCAFIFGSYTNSGTLPHFETLNTSKPSTSWLAYYVTWTMTISGRQFKITKSSASGSGNYTPHLALLF